MSFQKFKSDSFCVGGKNSSATKNIYGDITSKGNQVIFGFCSICSRRKSITLGVNTVEAERLGSFLKNLGRISAEDGKNFAINV